MDTEKQKAKERREQRLGQALRANLIRRKAGARMRKDEAGRMPDVAGEKNAPAEKKHG